MGLYKDKECTVPALCPMAFSNEYMVQTSFHCDHACAWCVYRESENAYTCGAVNVCQLMYAKEHE